MNVFVARISTIFHYKITRIKEHKSNKMYEKIKVKECKVKEKVLSVIAWAEIN